MTLVATGPILTPRTPHFSPAFPTSFNSRLIDASSEALAVTGHFWNRAVATKTITKVHFNAGAIVSAGGSALDISLQNTDLTAGPPARGDGTKDQTANVLLSALTATAWNSVTLGATRSLAFGEQITIMFEYDVAGRLGADTFNLRSIAASNTPQTPGVSHLTASWALVDDWAAVILEADDGTFGTLEGAFPVSAINSHAFNSGTGVADEYALEFTVPYSCAVRGMWVAIAVAAGADFEVCLFDGTTAMFTAVAVDANTIQTSNGRIAYIPFPETTLTINTTYRLSVRPTTANNVTLYSYDVAAAGHFQAHDAETSFCLTTRLNQGAWAAATTTRRLWMGLVLSKLDDGASGGGGGGGVWSSLVRA